MKTTYYVVNSFEKYKELLDHLELYTNRGYEKERLLSMWDYFKERPCIAYSVDEEGVSIRALDAELLIKKGVPHVIWTGKANNK